MRTNSPEARAIVSGMIDHDHVANSNITSLLSLLRDDYTGSKYRCQQPFYFFSLDSRTFSLARVCFVRGPFQTIATTADTSVTWIANSNAAVVQSILSPPRES